MKTIYTEDLYHHGIKGQKWGVRRYQNPDGTLTAAGKKRRNSAQQLAETIQKKNYDAAEDIAKNKYFTSKDRFNFPIRARDLVLERGEIQKQANKISMQANLEMTKKFGKPWTQLSEEDKAKYFEEGKARAAELGKQANIPERVAKWKVNARTLEKDTYEYFKDFFGEYGDLKVPNTLEVNMKDPKHPVVGEASVVSTATLAILNKLGLLVN